MGAVQVELRQHLFWRIGAVAHDISDFGNARALPAGGIGLRFQPTPKVPVNVSIDYAWGVNSQGLYLYVGEAF